MAVHIEDSVDLIAWKVIRTRPGLDGRTEYLTGGGWVAKDPGTQVVYDETMLWEDDDLRALADALNAKLKYKR